MAIKDHEKKGKGLIDKTLQPNYNWYKNFNTIKTSKKNFHNDNQTFASSKIKHKQDVLLEYPARGLAYSNEVGEALRSINKTVANALWAPALLYIGADVWDKYLRGKNADYEKPSTLMATREAGFQFLASVILPTKAVRLGEKYFPQICKKTSEFLDKKQILGDFSKKIQTFLKEKPNMAKSAGGFVFLALAAKPIDFMIEKVLLEKIIDPIFIHKRKPEKKEEIIENAA